VFLVLDYFQLDRSRSQIINKNDNRKFDALYGLLAKKIINHSTWKYSNE
jgi:hypothetical protein